MSGKNLRRVLAPGALALLLLAGPAWAGTWNSGPTGNLWHWLANLWRSGLSALWASGSTPAPPQQTSGDQGPGIDPNGGQGH